MGLRTGQKFCGLATTHLARPGGPALTGVVRGDGFEMSGTVDWVCGSGIFDFLLVGFRAEDEMIFAVVEFPTTGVKPQRMACLAGSSTVEITFSKFKVETNSIISRRKITGAPHPRPTKFLVPEIGIAKACVKEVELIVGNSDHPRKKLVADSLVHLKGRIAEIEDLRSKETPIEKLIFLRDETNRDAVRILALSCGAHCIHPESQVPRRQLELLLLDSVAQPPGSFKNKIRTASQGNNVFY